MSVVRDKMPVAGRQVVEVRLKSFDHEVLDRAISDIVFEAVSSNMLVKGPIPLPTKRSRYVVNRSGHVNKESREIFEINMHKRLLRIDPNSKPLDPLMRFNLPSGVDVEIELKSI